MVLGWFAGVAALAAHALGRPAPADAADGNNMKIGRINSGTTVTRLNTSGATALRVSSAGNSGANTSAIVGVSSGNGNRGVTGFGPIGVLGVSGGPGGFGVMGNATSASGTPRGVFGKATSATGFGVLGKNLATSGIAVGVQGETDSADGSAVVGIVRNTGAGDGAGLSGHGGSMGVFATGREHGVFAVTQTSGATAVTATSLGDNSIALDTGATGDNSLALRAEGAVKFTSSGIATITAGTRTANVQPEVRVTSTSKILCTLLDDPGTSRLLYVDPGTNAFTIHMSENVPGNVKAAWFVID